MEYFPWEEEENEDLALINKCPAEITDDKWKLTEGISCSVWFPSDVIFDLDPNSGLKIADSIPNTLNILIVSEKLKNILDDASKDFEFFEVGIRNAKGKLVRKKYFVANLVGTVSCVDFSQSDVRMSELDEGQIQRVKHLTLDESKIPEGRSIFRLGEMTQLYIVNEELGLKIAREEQCTGVSFTYMEDFGLEFR